MKRVRLKEVDRPRAIAGAKNVQQVSIGSKQACFVNDTTEVWCWGFSNSGAKRSAPIKIADGIAQVSVGDGFACARTLTGAVSCWGDNQYNQLGQLPNGPTVESIKTMIAHEPIGKKSAQRNAPMVLSSLADDLNEKAYALCRWEDAALPDRSKPAGPVGLPTPCPRQWSAPLAVPDLDQVVDVAADGRGACAVRATGKVVCWGDRRSPATDGLALANVAAAPSKPEAKPEEYFSGARVTVTGVDDAVTISKNNETGCAVRRNGSVSCWSKYGNRPRNIASACVGIDNAKSSSDHSWFVTLQSGQILRHQCDRVEAPLNGVADATSTSVRCALRQDGAVVCWGANTNGELGRKKTAQDR